MLSQLGLSKKAEIVYNTLLAVGESSITTLSKKSNLKRPTVYLVLDELEMFGLISRVKKGKRDIISAIHPRRVVQIAQLRAKTAEEKLPELIALYNAPKDKPKVQVFEGVPGVREVYKDIFTALSNKKEALWFARVEAFAKTQGAADEYLKLLSKLKNPKIRELNYESKESRKWADMLRKKRGTQHEIRYVPKEFEMGLTDGLILENKVVTFSLNENIFALVIESEHVAKTYRALFNLAWSAAKK